MAIQELSQDRIRHLYGLFQQEAPWRQWFDTFRKGLAEAHQASGEELATPAWQEKLWSVTDLGTIGQGEHVDVSGAFVDEQVVTTLVGLRSKRWPDEPNARAKAIQSAFDKVLTRVRDHHAKMRPQAKLGRLFMVLLPAEMHACYSWKPNRNIIKLILGPRRGLGYLESGVLVRLRLRAALGPEADLDEHARRAIFCWWLHERMDVIARGEDPAIEVHEDTEEQAPPPDEHEDIEPLTLWSVTKQFKGLTAVRGYQEGYRAVIAAAEQGASADDIVETMRSDFGFDTYAPKSVRRVFNRVRRHGFLEFRDGLWHPSDKGEQLLNEDPPDILVEDFLVKFFGLGHSLRIVAESGPLTRNEIFIKLREVYPSWTTNFAPSSTVAWGVALGLLDPVADGRLELSEYGRSWERRLPKPLPSPPTEPSTTPDDDDIIVDDGPFTPTTKEWHKLPQMLEAFETDEQTARFIFSEDQIRGLHLAWHSQPLKRFALLSGLSGTGKTKILLHYSRLYCKLLGIEDDAVERHRALVAVSPDWRDPSGLLGYHNALHDVQTFQVEPALRLVIAAANNPTLPFFLILDEMNLARVERYFAPFLSAMESGQDLDLHTNDEPLNKVPPKVKWPSNLFIGGTVNMDETTYPFSDKVLDRAYTLEFWNVDLEAWFPRRAASHDGPRFEQVEKLLLEINKPLVPIRRHFGYRSADEVLGFLDAAVREVPTLTEGQRSSVVDQALFSKVLPRVRGTESPALHAALESLLKICDDNALTKCKAKIETMQAQLRSTGVTRFWS